MVAFLMGTVIGVVVGILTTTVVLLVMAIREKQKEMRKNRMCKETIESGTCPHTCSKCAWNIK